MSKIETLLNEQNESNEQSINQSNERNELNERNNSKKRKNSDSDEPLFSKEEDDMIISLMKMGKSYSEICKEINEKIGMNKFTSKQIRQRWTNQTDPRYCYEPLSEEEKTFIIQYAEKSNGIIHWINLIPEMEKKFGKLRTENKLKNLWHSRKRSWASRNLPDTTDIDPFKSSLKLPPFISIANTTFNFTATTFDPLSSPPLSIADTDITSNSADTTFDLTLNSPISTADTDITSNSADTFDPFKKTPPPTPTAGIAYNFVAFDPRILTKSSIYFKATIFHAFTPSFLEPPTIVEPPKFKKLKLTFDF